MTKEIQIIDLQDFEKHINKFFGVHDEKKMTAAIQAEKCLMQNLLKAFSYLDKGDKK